MLILGVLISRGLESLIYVFAVNLTESEIVHFIYVSVFSVNLAEYMIWGFIYVLGSLLFVLVPAMETSFSNTRRQ